MTPKSINIAVAEQVEKLGSGKVVDTVVEKLVNAEVAKRAEALAAAIKLAEDTLKEQRKASKPDQVAIGANGEKVETFSPKAWEAKKKVEEKIAKIEKVVQNATESGDWGKLYELVKNGGQQPAAESNDAPANS
jgi:galactokinase/mevalonate kinase-like predicted kinase